MLWEEGELLGDILRQVEGRLVSWINGSGQCLDEYLSSAKLSQMCWIEWFAWIACFVWLMWVALTLKVQSFCCDTASLYWAELKSKTEGVDKWWHILTQRVNFSVYDDWILCVGHKVDEMRFQRHNFLLTASHSTTKNYFPLSQIIKEKVKSWQEQKQWLFYGRFYMSELERFKGLVSFYGIWWFNLIESLILVEHKKEGFKTPFKVTQFFIVYLNWKGF